MPDGRQKLFDELADAVFELDEERAKALSQEVLDKGYDAWEAVEQGLIAGVNRAGKLFDEEEYFVPELLIAADAMYAGLDILRPHIKEQFTGHIRKSSSASSRATPTILARTSSVSCLRFPASRSTTLAATSRPVSSSTAPSR